MRACLHNGVPLESEVSNLMRKLVLLSAVLVMFAALPCTPTMAAVTSTAATPSSHSERPCYSQERNQRRGYLLGQKWQGRLYFYGQR